MVKYNESFRPIIHLFHNYHGPNETPKKGNSLTDKGKFKIIYTKSLYTKCDYNNTIINNKYILSTKNKGDQKYSLSLSLSPVTVTR